MEFNFGFTGILHRAPERIQAGGTEPLWSADVVVRTGKREGRPHYEYIYVVMGGEFALVLEGCSDGSHVIKVSCSAIWAFAEQDLDGTHVGRLAVVANSVYIVRERRK